MTPAWVRALLAIDRFAARAHAWEATLRDTLLWTCVDDDERRDAITASIYGRASAYAPGGARFESGFFEWERRLLDLPAVPRAGRVLIGGAGGGRELRLMCERGYDVTAFEPCEPLAARARAVAANHAGARVLRGAYQDLDDALAERGPLASLGADAPYALVIAGWRSVSHVLDRATRLSSFKALARLAPAAPILASFLPQKHVARTGRLAGGVQRVLGWSGARGSAPDGAAFIPSAGFAVALPRWEIEAIAEACGRDLAVCEMEGEGVMLLTVPTAIGTHSSPTSASIHGELR